MIDSSMIPLECYFKAIRCENAHAFQPNLQLQHNLGDFLNNIDQ